MVRSKTLQDAVGMSERHGSIKLRVVQGYFSRRQIPRLVESTAFPRTRLPRATHVVHAEQQTADPSRPAASNPRDTHRCVGEAFRFAIPNDAIARVSSGGALAQRLPIRMGADIASTTRIVHMSNPITQAFTDPQNEVPQGGPAGATPMASARSAGDKTGPQRLWSRTSFSPLMAGRTFGLHNPTARAYSDVSTQL
jgi:hypothetical protein